MISKSFKRKRRIGEMAVLDFPPDDAWPGGHIGEEDPYLGLLSFISYSLFTHSCSLE